MVLTSILCGVITGAATAGTAVGTIVTRNTAQKKRFEKYLADGKKNPALTDEDAEAEFVNADNTKSAIMAIAASAGVAAICAGVSAVIGGSAGSCDDEDDVEVEE